MATEETREEKKRQAAEAREKEQVPATPRKLDFFEWAEKLFYDEPEVAHWPSWIEINPVSGKDFERVGTPVRRFDFGSKTDPKPTRPRIAAIANEIQFLVQRDCDIRAKNTVYGVSAWHFGKSNAPYERWIIRCKPGPAHAGGNGASSDDDEPESAQERFLSQVLSHQEHMFELYGGGFEGLLDRMDRILERQDVRILKQEERIEKQSDVIERALSHEADREMAREWNKMKVYGAQKGLDMGLALAPPLLNQLVGKTIIPTNDTAETITLRNFFKSKEDGGLLTIEQSNAAFGIYKPEPPHDLVKPGVLTLDQAKILYDVAQCRIPVDELDKVMPGGPLAITMDQVIRLRSECGFTMEQLAPLQLIFEARQKKKTAG